MDQSPGISASAAGMASKVLHDGLRKGTPGSAGGDAVTPVRERQRPSSEWLGAAAGPPRGGAGLGQWGVNPRRVDAPGQVLAHLVVVIAVGGGEPGLVARCPRHAHSPRPARILGVGVTSACSAAPLACRKQNEIAPQGGYRNRSMAHRPQRKNQLKKHTPYKCLWWKNMLQFFKFLLY